MRKTQCKGKLGHDPAACEGLIVLPLDTEVAAFGNDLTKSSSRKRILDLDPRQHN